MELATHLVKRLSTIFGSIIEQRKMSFQGKGKNFKHLFDLFLYFLSLLSFLPKLTPKIVTMELAFSNPVPISFWENMENDFLKEISKLDAERYFGKREKRCEFDSESGWPLCDLLAAVLWTDPEMAQESWEHAVGVEIEGKYSK